MTSVKFAPRAAENTDVNRKVVDWNPTVDILEGKEEYTFNIDAPGSDKDKLSITVKDGVLSVEGERTLTQPGDTDGKYFRYFERGGNRFLRTFRLPRHTKSDGVEGEYAHGVLTITVPKHEEAKPHTITIK